MEIIIGRNGTQKKPITDPTVSRQHCKVWYSGNGHYEIENLSPSGTKVNGVDIIRTTLRPESIIQLGPTFRATLRELIGAPVTPSIRDLEHKEENSGHTPTNGQSKTFNISHLRRVWDDFNQKNIEMADEQRKIGLVRGGGMFFTMGGGLVATLTAIPALGIIFSGIGIASMIYSFIGMKKSETATEKQERKDNFDLEWVCPNPDCRKPLPPKSYKVFINTYKECPYCKCKYVEK